jgi:lysophospholipase L1-like esterase
MTKRRVFYFIMLGLIFLVFEAIGYFSFFLFDDIYDHRKEVLTRIRALDLVNGKPHNLDPALGWTYRGPENHGEANCQGTVVEYSFDQTGARTYTGYDGRRAEIVVVGDSYTHGSEVADDDAFPAQLAKDLGLSVANHAVGGYGPVQAFLNLKEKIGLYPKAKVVILGMMFENIFRMVNSYRPVLAGKSSEYRFKPYMHEGHILPNPGQDAFVNIDSFLAHANEAFDNDFWSKPRHQFPFSVSYIRALGSNYFYFKRLSRKLRKIGIPEYFLAYRSESLSAELLSMLEQFTSFARERHLIPIVLFIPRDKYDTKSVSKFIGAKNAHLPQGLLVGDVGGAEIEWDRYNLIERKDGNDADFCHPSPYGYGKIAEYVADLLRHRGVLRD